MEAFSRSVQVRSVTYTEVYRAMEALSRSVQVRSGQLLHVSTLTLCEWWQMLCGECDDDIGECEHYVGVDSCSDRLSLC